MRCERGTFLSQKAFSFAALTTHRLLSFGQSTKQIGKLADFLFNTRHSLAKVMLPFPGLAAEGTHWLGRSWDSFPELSAIVIGREMIHFTRSVLVFSISYQRQPVQVPTVIRSTCQ